MKLTTPAIDVLDASGIQYRLVEYGPVMSAEEAARKRGIALEQLAKTLVIRSSSDEYVLVLIPGDLGLDYPKLRSHLGVHRLTMPSPEEAKQATGYERGTITPFGAGEWPVIVDERLMGHGEVSLGSGVAGWAIHLSPDDLVTATGASIVDVASAS